MATSKNKSKKINKKTNLKKKKIRVKIIKWTSLILLVIGAILLLLLSDIFNIKEINVINNNRISSEEIIKLSGIQVNDNIFKFLKFKAKDSIKSNPYVENVKIHRKINGTVEIDVEERTPTYMIEKEENYFYINNQGYILEQNSEKLEAPTIEGFVTKELIPGNRLEIADLKKLNIVIQIMQAAKSKEIAEKISKINVESDYDYIITMEEEQKTVHFGNGTRINDKITKIIPVLEDNVDVAGEIFVKDINKVYFRGDV